MRAFKNTTDTAILHSSSGVSFQPAAYTEFSDITAPRLQDAQMMGFMASGALVYSDSGKDYTNVTDAWDYFTGHRRIVDVASTPDPAPFAKPDYRVHKDAKIPKASCAESATCVAEYFATEDRYISGADLIIENAKFGDFISVVVYDKLGVIPEAVRASYCEAWPIVTNYIAQDYVKISNGPYANHRIDTTPLTGRIMAGLAIKLTYTSCDTVGIRSILVNLDLTKKL